MKTTFENWRLRREYAAAWARYRAQAHDIKALPWWERHLAHHRIFREYMGRAKKLQDQGWKI